MELPHTVPASQASFAGPPAPPKKSFRRLFFVTGVIVLCLVIAGVIIAAISLTTHDRLPQGMVIRLSDSGVSQLYSLDNTRLTPLIALPGFESSSSVVNVTEAVPSVVKEGERFVIARKLSDGASVFGILHADGTFAELRGGDTEKSGLRMSQKDLIVFSETLLPSTEVTAQEPTDTTADSASDGVVPPEGTVLTYQKGVDPAPAPFSEVVLPTRHSLIGYDSKNSQRGFFELGAGRDAHFISDDALIALAPEGLVTIRVASGERETVIPRFNADGVGGAFSPDGSLLSLPNANGTIDVYALRPSQLSVNFSYLGVVSRVGALSGAAFTDGGQFLIVGSDGSGALYRIPDASTNFAASLMARLSVIR